MRCCASACAYTEVRDLQSIDECECRYIFTAVGNFGELVLKVADVRVEAAILSYFDGEEVVILLVSRREAY